MKQILKLEVEIYEDLAGMGCTVIDTESRLRAYSHRAFPHHLSGLKRETYMHDYIRSVINIAIKELLVNYEP